MPHYVFDSNGNQPQSKFFTTVWQSALANLPYRYLFYGGAIRGGKTYVCLAVLISLLTKYNRAKAIVIRESLSALKSTTIPSFKKFGLKGKWKYTASSQIFEFYNKSELIFFSEAYATDKDGDRFKGLETNFILLEQIEELQEQTWQKSIERVGSHYVPGVQPSPLILSTFNPTQGWVKKMIYEPYSQGELVAPFYYQHASPKDNRFVTQEQWENWKRMDIKSYQRFIEGSWENFETDNLFAYSFNAQKHVRDLLLYAPNLPLYLSFDFNINPITCIAAQHTPSYINVLQEFRLQHSNIYKLCQTIKQRYPNANFVVTGDASGKNRSALVADYQHYYTVIKDQLNLFPNQLCVPNANPPIHKTRLLLNALFEKHKAFHINRNCSFLIEDLLSVKVDETGNIDKRRLPAHQTHLLDTLRYYVATFHANFLR